MLEYPGISLAKFCVSVYKGYPEIRTGYGIFCKKLSYGIIIRKLQKIEVKKILKKC